MDKRYAPREIEKKVPATFHFAPRHLRWLTDTSVRLNWSKAEVLRVLMDKAVSGDVQVDDKERAA